MANLFEDNDDWREVFAFSGSGGKNPANVQVVLGANCSDNHFTQKDIKSVFAYEEGKKNCDAWLICGQLLDGRYFFIEAWCDYTGWGCIARGCAYVSDTWERLYQFGIGDVARARFGITKIEDADAATEDNSKSFA